MEECDFQVNELSDNDMNISSPSLSPRLSPQSAATSSPQSSEMDTASLPRSPTAVEPLVNVVHTYGPICLNKKTAPLPFLSMLSLPTDYFLTHSSFLL